MRTFMSVPSRDLIISMAPSTASIVPRIRTVGGCCAHATDPRMDTAVSEATSTRGNSEEILVMGFPSDVLVQRPIGETPRIGDVICVQRCAECLLTPPWKGEEEKASHRRCQPVATDADPVGFERAVLQLLDEGDHLGAGLQV